MWDRGGELRAEAQAGQALWKVASDPCASSFWGKAS